MRKVITYSSLAVIASAALAYAGFTTGLFGSNPTIDEPPEVFVPQLISADVNGVEMTYQPTSLEQYLEQQTELMKSELIPPQD